MVRDLLSFESIDLFLKNKEEAGLKEETLKSYKRNLLMLLKFLPRNNRGKELNQMVLEDWVRFMLDEGVSIRTLNHRISSLNTYLAFIDRYDLQLKDYTKSPIKTEDAMLTRAEYIRLLTAARSRKNEQIFYLLRVIGSTGIRLADLDKLTVQFLKSEEKYINSSFGESIRIPQALKTELVEYAAQNDILTGPVFTTNTGRPLDRIDVHHSMAKICQLAHVPEHKVTPTNLRKLYFKTYNDTYERFRYLIEQAYDDFLECEQLMISWNGKETNSYESNYC